MAGPHAFFVEEILQVRLDILACFGVTNAPATPAMQGGGTLGGRYITELTVF